jgi:serine/threonine protein kinase
MECELAHVIQQREDCVVYFAVGEEGIGYAVKIHDDVRITKREAKVTQMFHHPNVIRVLGTNWFECPQKGTMKLGIVLYFADADLRTFLGYMARTMPAECRKRVEYQIKIQTARALAHVHDMGVWHMDVKPENFLINSLDDRNVDVQLIDFEGAVEEKNIDGELLETTTRTTLEYRQPEGFSSVFGEVFKLGKIYCELELTRRNFDENRLAVSVGEFSSLTQEMVHKDFRLRPLFPKVLERLGESTKLLLLDGCVYDNFVANAFSSITDVFDDASYDKTAGIFKLRTLLSTNQPDQIQAAFYILQELAYREAFDPAFPSPSVMSVLPAFNAYIHVNDNDRGRSSFNRLMYCRSLEALCQRSYFVPTNDMRLNLRAFSVIPACERSVLFVVAKTAERFPAILDWCAAGKWGKYEDRFEVFVNRFTDDWRVPVANLARALLKLPPLVIDPTIATTPFVPDGPHYIPPPIV